MLKSYLQSMHTRILSSLSHSFTETDCSIVGCFDSQEAGLTTLNTISMENPYLSISLHLSINHLSIYLLFFSIWMRLYYLHIRMYHSYTIILFGSQKLRLTFLLTMSGITCRNHSNRYYEQRSS